MATSGWAEDDLSTLHGLTNNAFYVKDVSKDMPREYPNYDCGLQKEYGTFDEIIQTSKKRYLYKGVGFMGRASGKNNLHNLEPEDLCALTVESAAMARVPLAGTNWIPGSK